MDTQKRQSAAAAWAASLLRSTLDLWLAAAANDTGLFHPYLDRRWKRLGDGPLTLVSQCRPIYNFYRGYELFGDTRYAEAARGGLTALQTYFRLAPGRCRWAVTGDGEEADPTPDAYGHAFSLLAQATAARALGDPGLMDSAMETWQYMSSAFTDDHGGLIWRLDGRPPDAARRSQNPVMHTFEALMALHSVDATGRARTAASDVLAFIGSLAGFTAGALIEEHTPDWTPLPVGQGGVVNLGHVFEWAWLLSEWHTITREPDVLLTGMAFLNAGLAWGLDADGGVREACAPDGRITASGKGLWQQCEAIRAMSRYVTAHGQTGVEADLQRTLSFFRRHFVDEEYGGVFASPEGLGYPARLDKGDAWKLDYHTVNMCLELIG
ncbi:MAG: AGE family epimerase/isomerase [Armatimonadetes bacterium]|nr:AGE family epimerase/isomerase [Armatimonadota bacterium]